jgi:phosphomannomutase/phosphoglucomutase
MRLRTGDKVKTAAKKAGDTPIRARAPSLLKYWVAGMVGIGLVVLLAFLSGLFLWVQDEERDDLAQARRCSALLVNELGHRAGAVRERLREWSADPRLRGALASPGEASLRSGEAFLAGLMPDALSIRLLSAGENGQGVGAGQSLSYAGLDLVNQAERERRVTPLEVHRVGEEDMHLAVAGPVLAEAEGEVLGVVHVSLPISLLPSVIDAGANPVTQMRFQQRAGDAVATVDRQQQGSPPERDPDLRIEVPGTRLQVAAWVTHQNVLDGDLPVQLLSGFAAVMVLIVLVSWLSLRSLRAALAADHAGIVAMAEDVAHGRPVRRIRCRLAESEPIVEVVGRKLRDLATSRQAERRAAAHRPADSRPGAGPASPLAEATGTKGDAQAGAQAAGGAEVMAPADGRQPAPGATPSGVEPLDLGALELEEVDAGDETAAAREGGADAVPERIFRAYDIRGIVGDDLTPELSRLIGLAVGSEVIEAGEGNVFVARDTRPSGTDLNASLIEGLRETGCAVIDLGVAPTPMLYFATRFGGDASGVMVTGSHNPAAYNGFKIVIGGISLAGERIAAVRQRILEGRFAIGEGSYRAEDLGETYIAHIERDVAIARSVRLIIDCGNGSASTVAGGLYRALGCEVSELNCDAGAGFPDGRPPDPTREECLEALRRAVVADGADLGFAFDGDGDRLGVVDSSGKVIWTDRVLMLLAADVLSRHPGTDVIFDVKSSHLLASEIRRNGGRPVMWRSGHSPLKAKLAETGALLAGEWSGHIIFRERWYGFDDALYAGARLVEVLALDPRPTAEVFAALPEAFSTPELIVPMAEGQAGRVMAAVSVLADKIEGLDVHKIDGVRVEHERGWGLVRASNTQPALVFRFEADDELTLDKLKRLFRKIMHRAAPDLKLPF